MPEFTADDVEILTQIDAYQGFYRLKHYQLRHRLFAGGWSRPIEREVVCRTPAVAVLLYDAVADAVVLIEQFRVGAMQHPDGPWQLEMVAGLIDTDEGPEQVAVRECQEEAGVAITPEQLHKVCEYLVSPGGSNESLTIYCAPVDASRAGGLHGLSDEGEDIRVLSVSRAEAWQWLQAGKITNAATIIALQWLQIHYPQWQTGT
ncbi:MAG: NUDIX domain-containing protein [Gammaproteobacteria bacterium]|nr:NUDIX domain-containing protein [Gammaproteobacteria bacterium]